MEYLKGRLIDAHREGFQLAMGVSCFFIRLIRLLEPSLNPSSSLITMSYLGGARAVQNYGLMGLLKLLWSYQYGTWRWSLACKATE
ncbi:hypothetical protein N482_20955 [Pseudoalteromonas luteoviolacea NCIMB 1942]|uniref:Uncharacterized protein n=1 Tax=Pseudoalteromonas luteoviolacea NCIMB 1942 TaxID=1365253 RepID=A0A166XT36_9GAMM|nr:hypothetical protein N482_20955 [Pseudoalteromonas luteoviolacea NCIMB 1942]